MSKYPEIITSDVLAQTANISDAEIEQDIADTEAEILAEDRKAAAQKEVARNTSFGDPSYKMAHFRADAYRAGAEQRVAFVAFLRRLQSARAEIKAAGQ